MAMEIIELLESARNCVVDFCGVKPGEEVLILASSGGHSLEERSIVADPRVIDAVAFVCKEQGANVTLITTEERSFNKPVPPVLEAAMCQANVIIGVGQEIILHGKAARAMYDYEALFCNFSASTWELMTSEWARYPMELTWAIAKRGFEQARKSKGYHVTDGAGTDMYGGINPTHITGFPVNIDPGPGLRCNHGFWPGICVGLHPEGDVYGVVIASYDHEHNLQAPMKLTVENHRIVSCEGGGEDGERWRAALKEIKDADWSAEMMWGLHPKVKLWQAPGIMAPMASRGAGTLHFGFGSGRALGGNIVAKRHDDVVLLKPSLWLDDFQMINNGRLTILDEPEIREIASEYGNPDLLLASEADL